MKLNLLTKPVAEVHIGTSIIYLYPLRVSDVNEYAGMQDEADPVARLRRFLPCIASLSVQKDFRDERQPLSDELIERMSPEALEELASAYIGIPSFDKVRAGNADENVAPVTRQAGETAISCLHRLLSAEAERQRRIFEKIYGDETPPDGDANQ